MTLRYAKNGKRDIHGAEQAFDTLLAKIQTERWQHDENRQAIVKYIQETLIGKVRSGKTFKKVGKSWSYRVIGRLRSVSEDWLKKPFSQITEEDWDDFYNKLQTDQILQFKGKKYTASTKAKICKTIKKFARWYYGKDQILPSCMNYWDMTEPVTNREVLTSLDVDKLVNAASHLRTKCIIKMLFDGGFRIEELGNLCWTDLRKQDKGHYQAHVRAETSKTKKERWVSLLLSQELIDAYKNSEKQRLGDAFSESGFLFESDYQSMRKTISRLGRQVLNRKVSPHIFRHSSATYFSKVIKTYQLFCARYGWNLNSPTAQRYFHAIADDEIAEQTSDYEISKFRLDFEKMKLEKAELEKVVNKLRDERQENAKLIVEVMNMMPELKRLVIKKTKT